MRNNPESISMAARVVLTSIAFAIFAMGKSADKYDVNPGSISGLSGMEPLTQMDPLQSVDERVNEIGKWYAEAQKLGEKNCKVYKTIKKDGLTSEQQFPFDQEVKACRLNDRYELVQGKFLGYEWGETVNIYKKDGKVFFVFVEGGAEAFLYENRYYCDRDETVIRHLRKESEGGDGLSKAVNKQVKLPPGRNNIHAYGSEFFSLVEEVMKAGK